MVKILDSGSSTTTRAIYGYDQQGQLTSATVGGTSYTYTYDTAGNIQSKKVGSTTTNYTYGNSAWRDLLTAYNGGSITYSGGNPTKYYDGSTFTWTQGRRLATAKVGSTNISYTYDPWGKIISSSGTLADINPLRYRGYYYDSETGFYYLQSRYYDPEIGRFINADSYASTDATGLLSTNMFAYCENDPVNKSDPTGEVAPILVAMAGGALVGIAEQFMTDVIYAMVTGQPLDACFSSVGTYVSSAVGGAMSVLPGGGVMRACTEIIMTSYLKETIDMMVSPEKYNEKNPNNEIIKNAFTSGASKYWESKSSELSDKLIKSATQITKNSSATTKKIVKNAAKFAGSAIKYFSKYVGNVFSIVSSMFRR